MYPEVMINNWLWEQFRIYKPTIYAAYDVRPIFPIDDVQAGDSAWDGKTHILYDSMARPRTVRKSFYPVKQGQLLYSIKGPIEEIFEWREFMIDALDREDTVAREINEFTGGGNVYLHNVCAYQFNYVNTAYKQLPTQRKQQTTDLVVPFEYHRKSQFT